MSFQKWTSYLKDCDMFAVNVTDMFNFERQSFVKGKTYHRQKLGSYCGGLMTIVYYMMFFGYLSTLIAQMESGSIDHVKSIVVSNTHNLAERKN